MTEENNNEIIDLDFDMSDPTLQLERPVIKECVTTLQVVSTSRKKTGKGANMLVVQFKTAEPTESTAGKELSPGLPVFDQMMLEDVGAMKPGSWRDKVGRVHLAITGSKEGKPSTADWQGKTVKVKLTVRPQRTDEATGKSYPESNEISFYYPPTAA